MVTPEDQASPEGMSTSYRRVFTTRTLWIVLLFAVALIAYATIDSTYPTIHGFQLLWLIPTALLGALVAVERRSIEPRTLNVLLWGIGGIVFERVFAIILLYVVLPRILDDLPLNWYLFWGDRIPSLFSLYSRSSVSQLEHLPV